MGYNSTIVTKKKNLSCGHFDYNFSKGRCKQCATIDSTKKRIALANEAPKIRKIAATEQDAELAKRVVAKRNELEIWFDTIRRRHSVGGEGAYCMETGDWIPFKYIRAATAHLLPKSKFPSVATHELNYLILSAHNGSHQKTDRLDQFVKMKVWPEAARRIKIMMPLLPFDELKYISSQLLAELDKVK